MSDRPKITAINIPPPGVRREPVPPQKKLSIAIKPKIEQFFREELLRPRSPLDTVLLRVVPDDPQIVQLRKIAATAMAAFWLRGPGLDTAAITLIIGGIDASDDEAVLQEVHRFLVGGEQREEVLKLLDELMALVRMEPRPRNRNHSPR